MMKLKAILELIRANEKTYRNTKNEVSLRSMVSFIFQNDTTCILAKRYFNSVHVHALKVQVDVQNYSFWQNSAYSYSFTDGFTQMCKTISEATDSLLQIHLNELKAYLNSQSEISMREKKLLAETNNNNHGNIQENTAQTLLIGDDKHTLRLRSINAILEEISLVEDILKLPQSPENFHTNLKKLGIAVHNLQVRLTHAISADRVRQRDTGTKYTWWHDTKSAITYATTGKLTFSEELESFKFPEHYLSNMNSNILTQIMDEEGEKTRPKFN